MAHSVFFVRMGQDWKDKYIKGQYALAPVYSGVVLTLIATISGSGMFGEISFLPAQALVAEVVSRTAINYWFFPQVRTTAANRSAEDPFLFTTLIHHVKRGYSTTDGVKITLPASWFAAIVLRWGGR